MIDATTGALSFIAAPNFEAPTEADGDNVYDVTVQVSDGTLTDSQAIAVAVTDFGGPNPTRPRQFTITVLTPWWRVGPLSSPSRALGATSRNRWTFFIRLISLIPKRAPGFATLSDFTGTNIPDGTIKAIYFDAGSSTATISFQTVDDDMQQGGQRSFTVELQPSPDYTIEGDVKTFGFIYDNHVPPVISSDGGGATATVSVAENTTVVTTVAATAPDIGQTVTYAIVGGADAAKFTIDATTGALALRRPRTSRRRPTRVPITSTTSRSRPWTVTAGPTLKPSRSR